MQALATSGFVQRVSICSLLSGEGREEDANGFEPETAPGLPACLGGWAEGSRHRVAGGVCLSSLPPEVWSASTPRATLRSTELGSPERRGRGVPAVQHARRLAGASSACYDPPESSTASQARAFLVALELPKEFHEERGGGVLFGFCPIWLKLLGWIVCFFPF